MLVEPLNVRTRMVPSRGHSLYPIGTKSAKTASYIIRDRRTKREH